MKSSSTAPLALLRYGAGAALIVGGIAILASATPIYLKPLGLGVLLAGAVLLPVVFAKLARLSKQFEPLRVSFIMAGGMLWGGVALSIAAYNAWEKMHPEIAASKSASRVEEKGAEAAREREEASRGVAEQKADALAKRGERQRALSTMWGQLTSQMEPCEKSQEYLAKALGRPGGLVQSYQMATQGQQVCFQSNRGVQQITAPDVLSDKAAKLTTEGLTFCADAMLARLTFMNIAEQVIDGDRRPSKLADAQAQNQAAAAATLQCVAKLTEGAMADGLKLEKP